MTAPERIYMKPNDMYENGWARPIDTDQFDEEATEYVRADLAAVQPAQVRVKPLVWDDGTNNRKYAKSEIGQYSAREFSIDNVRLDLDGKLLAGSFNTIKAAMIAAQANYEARVIAALEPQPDPRDEVIKGLVDALTNMLEIRAVWTDPHNDTDCKHARAALAAAKAVQHG